MQTNNIAIQPGLKVTLLMIKQKSNCIMLSSEGNARER